MSDQELLKKFLSIHPFFELFRDEQDIKRVSQLLRRISVSKLYDVELFCSEIIVSHYEPFDLSWGVSANLIHS